MNQILNNLRYFQRQDQKSRLLIRPSIGGYGQVAEITISKRTQQALRTQIDLFRLLPRYDEDPEKYEHVAEAAIAFAAPVLVDAIHALLSSTSRVPAMFVIRGLQLIDDPVLTPLDGEVDQVSVSIEAAVLIGVMRHFGLGGTAFATENGGRLFRAVCPVRRDVGLATSQGAATDLTSHVDNGHYRIANSLDVHPAPYPVMNSHQFFVTVRPDPVVPMRVKLNEDVYARFDPQGTDPTKLPQFSTLFEALYSYASPPSHGNVNWIERLPLLVERHDKRYGLAMRLHCETTRGSSPASVEALDLLKRAISVTPEEVVHTRRGDILGYLNDGATHRREPFAARFDGTDRYYLRVYGNERKELECWATRMQLKGRVM